MTNAGVARGFLNRTARKQRRMRVAINKAFREKPKKGWLVRPGQVLSWGSLYRFWRPWGQGPRHPIASPGRS